MNLPTINRTHVRAALTAIPIVICNAIAFGGQLSFIKDHLHWVLIGDIGFAAGIESIGIFLAYMAHAALMSGDSSFRLRMGSYAAGAVAAGLNYSHFAVHMKPNFAAIGTALFSVASPILWGIYSRRVSRDALMAQGLIEGRSLRLGVVRWAWHPVRSWRVMAAATWSGVTTPAEAIAAVEPQAASSRLALDYQPESLSDMTTQADAVRFSLGELARASNRDIGAVPAREVATWLEDRRDELAEPWQISTSYISDIIRRTQAARERAAGSKVTQLPQAGRHTA
jgi:Protein of unknown function (DUF2637)